MMIPRVTLAFVSLTLIAAHADATTAHIDLGTAASFGVLAGSTVTNTGLTTVNGDLGVWPNLAVTGFGPGIVTNGAIHAGDSVAMQAQADLTSGYNAVSSQACGTDLSGQDLGGLVLTSGVYCFSSSAQLTGAVTLNAQGDPNAFFIFQIDSTLTTASDSSIVLSNFGPGTGSNIYWQVGSSATLGTGTSFTGNILALDSISFTTNASISCGSALARNGAVTMDTNTVSVGCDAGSNTPEPSSAWLLASGLVVCLCVPLKSRVIALARRT